MNIPPQGAGLGFRREITRELEREMAEHGSQRINFFEIAPENWLHLGGRYKKQLRQFTEQYAFTCHGLSLSIGSCAALDIEHLKRIKTFLTEHNISLYTEHLSWCSDDGHLYDLLPIPCTTEAVHWVASRIRQAQDILAMPIGMENASYYLNPPNAEMTEAEFIRAVITESDCLLHLDVNNIYVNSQNFNYDPLAYLKQLPLDKTAYIHVAGHYTEPDGLIIDTHGANVIDPVWSLLQQAYKLLEPLTGKKTQQIPTCLERDFNFPPLNELMLEVDKIHRLQNKASRHE